MHHLVYFWFQLVSRGGYLGIIALMAMESSIVPVPSEVVIPPAAYWASQGQMSFWGVIFAGTLGSWIGAAITYWVALKLGRLLVVRWGRFFLVSEAKLERAERFVHRYETGGIFFARLLPVVRHLISIPAGLIKMSFGAFSAMTLVGSFIWCYILALFGRKIAENQPHLIDDPAAMVAAIKSQSMLLVLCVAGLCGLYLLVIWMTAKKEA